MTQSSEYPDLPFSEPAAFGTGRDGKAVRYIVIHYTAGAERSTSAEDGAAYDARRTDGTSTHYFVDQNSIVQCVLTKDRANAARHRGNRLGIQYELCGTAQARAQWLDTASSATLALAAKQVARDCKKYGIPVQRLTVAETRAAWTQFPAGPKGIVGHVDVTNAYPEDDGTHTDPGPEFPWDVFLALVREELEDDEMKEADWTRMAQLLDDVLRGAGPKVTNTTMGEHSAGDSIRRWDANGAELPLTDPNPFMSTAYTLGYFGRVLAGHTKTLASIAAGVASDDDVNEAEIVAGILVGLTPEKIAAAIPADIASQVADILAARLAS